MTGPLDGRRVLVTRSRDQAAGIVDALHRRGATVVVVPLISTRPLVTPDQITEAATRLRVATGPRWVAFTSATAARLVLRVLDGAELEGVSMAVVGPETAAAVREGGREPDLVAAESDAAGLTRELCPLLPGGALWLPAAEGGRDDLVSAAHRTGVALDVQTVYRSEMPADAPRRLAAALEQALDAVTLTSGSTVRHLTRALDGRGLGAHTVVAVIGPRTADDARAAGLRVDVIARLPSAEGLAQALAEHFHPVGTLG